MKHKNNISLKNRIFVNFLICSLCLVILIRNLDGLYYEYLIEYISYDLWEKLGWVYFILSFVIQVGAALVFYKFTGMALKKESERQVKEKDLVYAAVAHDLKTPMTSVQGFAKALSDGKIEPEEQQEILDLIYRKSKSMNEMVNTLFEYAKLGTEEYQPVMSSIDLCSLVRDLAAEHYTDLEEHNITLDIEIPDGTITVNGDKNELRRAVSNLITNVYKHNPSGIKAKISVGREKNKAVIMIADSGNPIHDDMDIFRPFVTENSARTIGHGTGLGLAITKRIVERHGGELYLNKNNKSYSKSFTAEIPIAAEK